jgi:hypothetical protein
MRGYNMPPLHSVRSEASNSTPRIGVNKRTNASPWVGCLRCPAVDVSSKQNIDWGIGDLPATRTITYSGCLSTCWARSLEQNGEAKHGDMACKTYLLPDD